MIEDELIKIWQSSSVQERLKFEKSRFMIEVQSNLDRLDKVIRNRYLVEYFGQIIVIPVFAFYAFIIPFTLTKIASVLSVVWGIARVLQYRSAKRRKPVGLTEDYVSYLTKSKQYILDQIKLAKTINTWYLFSALPIGFLFFLGMHLNGIVSIRLFIGVVIFMIILHFINKRANQKAFLPRLEKIDQLLRVMNE